MLLQAARLSVIPEIIQENIALFNSLLSYEQVSLYPVLCIEDLLNEPLELRPFREHNYLFFIIIASLTSSIALFCLVVMPNVQGASLVFVLGD